jgi:hypothetical protein
MRKQSRALGAEISLAVADLVVTRHPRACGDSIVTMGPNITESGVPHDGIAAAIVTKSARDWPLQRFSKCMAPGLSPGTGPVSSTLRLQLAPAVLL